MNVVEVLSLLCRLESGMQQLEKDNSLLAQQVQALTAERDALTSELEAAKKPTSKRKSTTA